MADTKLSALPALGAAPDVADLLYLDDVSASTSKSMTVANLFQSPTINSPTLVTPLLGTPNSGNLSNTTGFPTANLSGLGTGVATFLATPSSANLKTAVTDETGSGALVFATSPSLVTPTGIVKGDVGLGNVDNTSDATKNSAVATLTNKRITRRTATTNAPGATPTTNSDNVEVQIFTGLATAITSMSTNLSGTPTTGQFLEFWLTDNATARAITWGASFAATTVALPTTTVISTKLRVLFEWGGSTWDCVAVC